MQRTPPQAKGLAFLRFSVALCPRIDGTVFSRHAPPVASAIIKRSVCKAALIKAAVTVTRLDVHCYYDAFLYVIAIVAVDAVFMQHARFAFSGLLFIEAS